jgi:FixJ family two-component response regulator
MRTVRALVLTAAPVGSLVTASIGVTTLRAAGELAFKLEELRPGTPTLFISGYTDSEIVRRGLLEPDTAFLPKPFTADALVRAVQARLKGPAPAHAGE